MVFSSAAFLFAFFPVYIAVVALVRNIKACNVLLVVMSLLFYAWGEPVYILLMLLSIFVNYLIALSAEKYRDGDSIKRRTLLSLAIIYNLTALGLFKYAGFLVSTLNSVAGTSVPVPQIPLPVGISFFTFQTMSYVIDAYRGTCSVQRNIGKFMLYVSFFPQLIAGPIVKYHDIEKQLDCRSTNANKIADGIRRFIVGLSKKMLIANAVGSIVDQIYSLNGSDINIILAWTAAILYSLQIYFDFSGYSDMAIGLGKMAGFKFLENFNYPYTSFSVREFWKRWHISLTTWFREYVYFPLGGNRKGELRTGINRMSVFLLTGMWHGAMWTFVVWGVFHGVFQLLETYLIHPDKWKKPLAYLYAMAVVVAGFAIFRADCLGQAVNILCKMAVGFRFTDVGLIMLQGLLTPYNFVIVAAAFIAMTPILRDTADALASRYNARQTVTCMKYAASVFLMALCMMSLASSSYNPFIYFRF
jgi:Predicted membrane protein involved in D-alanine export